MLNCPACNHPAHKAGKCKTCIPPEPHMADWTGPRCKCKHTTPERHGQISLLEAAC
jgi:hypothetical protein